MINDLIAGQDSYEYLNREIKTTMRRSASDAVRLRYLLRRMYDGQLWLAQYDCLDEYLQRELHMDYSLATRFMNINKKYSVGGNSEEIEDDWAGFSQSVLIEMLSMPPELIATITPDMPARKVRKIKQQAAQEKEREKKKEKIATSQLEEDASAAGEPAQLVHDMSQDIQNGSAAEEIPETEAAVQEPDCRMLGREEDSIPDDIPDAEFREVELPEEVATSQPERSAYGLEKTVYPEDSLIAEAGCGHKYSCFSCAQDCSIRQGYRYCIFAPLGNPFECDRMEALEEIRAEAGERCQFINNDLAYHTAGTGEAAPCCTNCKEECAFRCRRSCQMEADKQQKTSDSNMPEENQEDGIKDELAEMKRILEDEQKVLDDCLKVAEEDKMIMECQLFKKQTIIVAALSEMVHRMEEAEAEPEPEEKKQPPLPPLKNNDQRREWLRDYKAWGFWYRDENIGVDYYKYDFANGARLIAEVYQEEATRYHDAYEPFHLHLVGGPKPPEDKHGICRWQWHGKYTRYPNNETELAEFLKEVQRNG